VVLFRGGALALGGDGFLMQAGFTLAVSVIMQTVMMGLYLAFRERDQLKAVLVHWRPSLSVGVAGALASICWFTAFTMQNAAYVRALGQIELIFTFIASAVFFREKINRLEFTGILLVAGGILILLLVG
jgi:drug/metabolite transporter (DMT)-like permease